MFRTVTATAAEQAAPRPGDALVTPADVVMDRAFTAPAAPDVVWPWLAQLGKQRAGWYLPAALERLLPRSRRASWSLNPDWTALAPGDVIPDYGGRDATFTVAEIEPPHHVVYTSRRGATEVSWSLTLLPAGPAQTRVCLRLRLGPVRHRTLAATAGGLFDAATIAGMAAGLTERLAVPPS